MVPGAGLTSTPSPALDCRLVTTLRDALIVRRLRNSCAQFMTNVRESIGWWAQVTWYFRHYRPGLSDQNLRIFLFAERRSQVGYGALKLDGDQLLVTECIAPEHRGRGLGKAILGELIRVAGREGRALIAEIWASNAASVRLHESAGFRLDGTTERQGLELRIYSLRVASPGNP